jgi:hypothetical protein
MRRLGIVVGILAGLGTITAANAALRCTPNSCIDDQTGVYTQSHCDYNGCQPLGGVVGRLGPGGYDSAYDYGGPRYYRHYHHHHWHRY